MARSSAARRPERDLAAVEAEHEVEGAGALHVVARHEQRAALRAQLLEEPHDRVALAGSTPDSGSSSRSTGASCTSARASSARWRWPPERLPKRMRVAGEPDPLERGRARRRSGRRGEPPAPVRERAHQRHVERGDGEVEPRALGLGDVAGPPASSTAAAGSSSPSSTRNRVVLPPPLDRARTRTPSRGERDLLEHRRAAVAGGEAVHGRRQPLTCAIGG